MGIGMDPKMKAEKKPLKSSSSSSLESREEKAANTIARAWRRHSASRPLHKKEVPPKGKKEALSAPSPPFLPLRVGIDVPLGEDRNDNMERKEESSKVRKEVLLVVLLVVTMGILIVRSRKFTGEQSRERWRGGRDSISRHQ